ncbi:Hypothetical predicted protein [Olea europaea subsp. europaea]|uniref:Uncharacterized protein n=1 Tax=Olea europaea subsp. europaea TaxID=158383 RepID=A0A8S0TJZ1_OLEEU|nr:Hypothetical predicted protein [Olea europaea subsp. europaea]
MGKEFLADNQPKKSITTRTGAEPAPDEGVQPCLLAPSKSSGTLALPSSNSEVVGRGLMMRFQEALLQIQICIVDLVPGKDNIITIRAPCDEARAISYFFGSWLVPELIKWIRVQAGMQEEISRLSTPKALISTW